MNLIQNSVNAIEGRGVIKIKTFQDDGDVCVEIADTGVGIPTEKLERIFDVRFSKGGPRVEMGFGLSLDYKIIEQHGGAMRIESQEGEGTRVTIRFPQPNSG
jgi:signal transduction histidine kinase